MQITVNFNPVAPVGAQSFASLRLTINDASGAEKLVIRDEQQVKAQAVAKPNGSFDLVCALPPLAVGAYSVVVQAYDSSNKPMGTALNYSGVVSLADGVWFPQPVLVTGT